MVQKPVIFVFGLLAGVSLTLLVVMLTMDASSVTASRTNAVKAYHVSQGADEMPDEGPGDGLNIYYRDQWAKQFRHGSIVFFDLLYTGEIDEPKMTKVIGVDLDQSWAIAAEYRPDNGKARTLRLLDETGAQRLTVTLDAETDEGWLELSASQPVFGPFDRLVDLNMDGKWDQVWDMSAVRVRQVKTVISPAATDPPDDP